MQANVLGTIKMGNNAVMAQVETSASHSSIGESREDLDSSDFFSNLLIPIQSYKSRFMHIEGD